MGAKLTAMGLSASLDYQSDEDTSDDGTVCEYTVLYVHTLYMNEPDERWTSHVHVHFLLMRANKLETAAVQGLLACLAPSLHVS